MNKLMRCGKPATNKAMLARVIAPGWKKKWMQRYCRATAIYRVSFCRRRLPEPRILQHYHGM
ncbi:hypothetical protein LU604_19495 [Erwinia tracheiphila]|uniref:hypothetical protein n=1 Tax=Erwinia tracheiphila TaxID=65700 RepID=UPI001F28471D|nr:hypothetical protein [Erwinia tracheiphila]UIA82652.1 hypothetical protein LU604_19495 [Erwinia tracheiphila]UIA91241.1 hypothetical protein LU632_19025 [Erwinia tracheiphila]